MYLRKPSTRSRASEFQNRSQIDFADALTEAGWKDIEPTAGLSRFPYIAKPLDEINRGVGTDFLTLQWYFLARV